MLVEQEVELVEGMASNLPVMFLVKIAKSNRIREKLIQIVGTPCADFLR